MNAKSRRLRFGNISWLFVVCLIALAVTSAAIQGAYAQGIAQGIASGIAPDYAIRNIRTEFSGAAQIAIVFDVVNNGGAATSTATAKIQDLTGAVIGSPVTVEPLGQFESAAVRIEFPTYLFANYAGQIVSLTATVGLNEIENANSETAGDNNARISLQVPNLNATVEPSEDTLPAQTAPSLSGVSVESLLRGDPIALSDSIVIPDGRLLILGGVIGFFVLLILIWMFTLILRLLFSRPPVFINWQPPYTAAAYLDPNSLAGRRGLWQPHAQSDSLPVPCQPGTFAARKLLMGVNGVKLNGWHVSGIRLNQYDMYGRVARSQVIGDPRTVKQLDRLARRSTAMNRTRAERRVRGISNKLIREFRGKLNKRSAMLPLAMDVRLDGRHGEVRIVFELHQCAGNGYQPVDTWEPEMVVTTNGGIIHENFTYTLYGQRAGEKTGVFLKRLRTDINVTLAQMIAGMTDVPPGSKPAPADRRSPPTPPSAIPPAPTTPPEITGDTAQVGAEVDPTPTPGRTTPQSHTS